MHAPFVEGLHIRGQSRIKKMTVSADGVLRHVPRKLSAKFHAGLSGPQRNARPTVYRSPPLAHKPKEYYKRPYYFLTDRVSRSFFAHERVRSPAVLLFLELVYRPEEGLRGSMRTDQSMWDVRIY